MVLFYMLFDLKKCSLTLSLCEERNEGPQRLTILLKVMLLRLETRFPDSQSSVLSIVLNYLPQNFCSENKTKQKPLKRKIQAWLEKLWPISESLFIFDEVMLSFV